MGKLKNLLTTQYDDISRIFSRYWLTLFTTIIYSIFLIITNHITDGIWKNDWSRNLNTFLPITIAGCMFIESIFEGDFLKRTYRGKILSKPMLFISYIAAVTIALFFMCFSILTEEEGRITEKTCDIMERVLGFYIIVLIGYSIYEIIRQSKLDFTVYGVSLVFGLVKVCSVCLAFNLGFILIFEMIDVLLFEINYDIYYDLQYVLLGFVYTPYALICLTTKKEEKGKFPKVFLLYVLMPMVFLAIAVIYAYIVKIIGRELPSNEVYSICITLFIVGGIIWTLSHGILKTHYSEKLGIYAKMIQYVPYTFFPFLVLEIYCLWVRIAQYGLTTDRYYGILVIVGQMIYLFWAIIPKLFKKKVPNYENLILVILALVCIMLICPGINAQSAAYLSQKSRYEAATAEERYTDAHSAFAYLYRDSYGKAYLNKKYDESELEALIQKLDDFSAQDNSIESTQYLYIYENQNEVVDIQGYRMMQSFSWADNDNDMDILGIEEIRLNNGNTVYINIEELASYFIDIHEKYPNDDINAHIQNPYYYKIDEEHMLVINRVNISYYKSNKYFNYISFNGYLLTK